MLYELTADTGHRVIVKGWRTRTHGGAPAVPEAIRTWAATVWLPSLPGAASCEVAEFHPAVWGRMAHMGPSAPYPDRLSWSTVIGEVHGRAPRPALSDEERARACCDACHAAWLQRHGGAS